MADFNNDWLLELTQKCGIVETISPYVSLTKKGSKYFGCCPFHNEKTGSFCVNPDEGYYHCFGCNETGGVVKFIMQIESCDFWDAVKILAEKVNFTLPEFKRGQGNQERKDEKEIMYSCMRDAFVFYYKNLRGQNGAEAAEYLKSRGINEETAKRYGLGLAPDGDGLIKYLRLKEYSAAIISDCGLSEGTTDAFSGRIIVPIADSMGKVIAFGGRIYRGEQNRPKYKNSTNTLLFDKSKTLYGAHLVKEEKRKGGLKELILVEGYMDVISLGAAGIFNAVAGMGTALTAGQANELFRLSRNIVVCYDGDEAGRKAAVRNVEILAKTGAEVKIINLPDGCDPDDYIKKHGGNEFLKLVENAYPLIDFKLLLLENEFGLNSANGRARYAAAAAKILSEVNDAAVRAIYVDYVAKKCGITAEQVLSGVKLTEVGLNKKVETNIENKGANYFAEMSIIHCLIKNKPYANALDFEKEWFKSDSHKEIFEEILKLKESGNNITAGILLLKFDSTELKEAINFGEELDEAALQKYFFDSGMKIADTYLNEVIEECGKLFDSEKDAAEKMNILMRLSNAQKKLKSKNLTDKKFI